MSIQVLLISIKDRIKYDRKNRPNPSKKEKRKTVVRRIVLFRQELAAPFIHTFWSIVWSYHNVKITSKFFVLWWKDPIGASNRDEEDIKNAWKEQQEMIFGKEEATILEQERSLRQRTENPQIISTNQQSVENEIGDANKETTTRLDNPICPCNMCKRDRRIKDGIIFKEPGLKMFAKSVYRKKTRKREYSGRSSSDLEPVPLLPLSRSSSRQEMEDPAAPLPQTSVPSTSLLDQSHQERGPGSAQTAVKLSSEVQSRFEDENHLPMSKNNFESPAEQRVSLIF